MKNILKRAGICHNLWQKTFCLAVLFITTWWKLYLDWVCLANRPEQTRIHSGISITSFLISSHHLSNSCVIPIWNDSTFVTYVFFTELHKSLSMLHSFLQRCLNKFMILFYMFFNLGAISLYFQLLFGKNSNCS
jgi:hypothetical protein